MFLEALLFSHSRKLFSEFPYKIFVIALHDIMHLIPKWPPFQYSFVFVQISPCCSFVNSKFKTILSLKRGNKSNLQVNKRIPKFQPFCNKVFWPTKFLIVPLPIITRITMCNLHWCYTFCTGVTLDCTALNTHISILYYISTNTSCSAIYLTSLP